MSSPLKTVIRQLRLNVRSDEIKIEIDEELQFHLEMRTEENINAGMTPEAARTDAQNRFGDYHEVSHACYVASDVGSVNNIGLRESVPLVMTFFSLALLFWTMNHPYNDLLGLFTSLLCVLIPLISFVYTPRFFKRRPIVPSGPVLGLVENEGAISGASFYDEKGRSPLERLLEDR
jgi:hypothetical protein